MPNSVLIAVIDSGVQPDHPHILADRLEPGFAVLADGTVQHGADATIDRLGHGTAVIAAIQDHAPEARIVPIRVFHDTLRTSPRALIVAIDAAAASGAALVNLSLGTTNPAHAAHFAAAVARCPARIIAPRVAADGAPCWPGMIVGVIAVELDWSIPRDQAWRDGAAIIASGHPRPIPGVPQARNLHGISFATANACGLIAAGRL